MSSARLFAAVLATLVAGCAAPAAPGCDAEPTRERAAEAVVRELSLRGGSREVAGQPDVLIGSRGDTVRLVRHDGRVAIHKGAGLALATLQNARATGGNGRSGWRCEGETLVADLSEGARPEDQLPPIPISYTSSVANARHVVKVRIQWDQVRR